MQDHDSRDGLKCLPIGKRGLHTMVRTIVHALRSAIVHIRMHSQITCAYTTAVQNPTFTLSGL